MYCPKCGTLNDDNNWRCMQCNAELHASAIQSGSTGRPGADVQMPRGLEMQAAMMEPIRDYLVQSILVTLFCCLPFGIPAIVYAAQARTKRDAGDYEAALRASKSARLWCWVAFGAGLFFVLVWVALIVIGASQATITTY